MYRQYCFALSITAIFLPADLRAESYTPPLPQDAKQSCVVSQSEFSSDWGKLTFPVRDLNPVTGKTIGPFYDKDSGIVYVFPPNGPGFNPQMSNYSDDTGDCAFFQWSSQMFMWLTSTVSDSATIPAIPKSPDANTKYVFASEFMYHLVDNHKTLAAQSPLGKDGKAVKVRSGKQDSVDSVGQAGFTEGVLYTQADTSLSGKSSLVYYSVHTNRPYGYLRDAVNNNVVADGFTKFPDNAASTCNVLFYGLEGGFFGSKPTIVPLILFDLYCRDQIENGVFAGSDYRGWLKKAAELAADSSAKTLKPFELGIPEVEMAVDFLSMALEVKASWVAASTLKNPENYIRQQGVIPVFDESRVNYVQTGVKTEELALIGMHVVGSVNGHPEMIWATFEHADNAPNAAYAYLDVNGQQKIQADLLTKFGKDWLLSTGTLIDLNTEYATLQASGSESTIVQALVGKDARTPSNVIRMSPWGSQPTPAAAHMNSQMISVNNTALTSLYRSYDGKKVSDPRLNYILTGSSWGKDGKFPDGMHAKQIAGTPSMANTSMETFQQISNGEIMPNGCFSCHGTIAKPDASFNGFTISHIFGKINKVEK